MKKIIVTTVFTTIFALLITATVLYVQKTEDTSITTPHSYADLPEEIFNENPDIQEDRPQEQATQQSPDKDKKETLEEPLVKDVPIDENTEQNDKIEIDSFRYSTTYPVFMEPDKAKKIDTEYQVILNTKDETVKIYLSKESLTKDEIYEEFEAIRKAEREKNNEMEMWNTINRYPCYTYYGSFTLSFQEYEEMSRIYSIEDLVALSTNKMREICEDYFDAWISYDKFIAVQE